MSAAILGRTSRKALLSVHDLQVTGRADHATLQKLRPQRWS
jgi:hypothetical protein